MNRWRRQAAGLAALVGLSGCGQTGAGGLMAEVDAEVPGFEAGIALDVGRPGEGSSDAGPADVVGGPDDDGGGVTRDAGPVDATGDDAGGLRPEVPDPSLPGPYEVAAIDATHRAPSGHRVPMRCRYPERGPSPGPHPAVLFGPGFQIGAEQYLGYADRLASFGYVACIAAFPATLRADHVTNADDLRASADWLLALAAEPGHPLQGRVDPDRLGIMGHSLGGKVAFLAAADDRRFRAVLGLDPVDGGRLCPPSRCPDATDLLPLPIPVGVLGETTDAGGGLQSCAPAADNFQTFYEAANGPALEVEVLGANHVSFLDDPNACGLPCRVCRPATADHEAVIGLARAYTVAFFERHLRGLTAYEPDLVGRRADARYVQTGLARLRSK